MPRQTVQIDGSKMKKARARLCLTQEGLSDINLSVQVIRKAEQGEPVALETLARIADKLGVDVKDLLPTDIPLRLLHVLEDCRVLYETWENENIKAVILSAQRIRQRLRKVILKCFLKISSEPPRF